MRKSLLGPALLLGASLAAAPAASAGGVEISGFAGYTFPFYSQTFAYSPGPISVPIPGVSIEQGGAFELKASGGPVFGGAIAFYPTDTFGFELRLDHAEVDVKSESSTFDVKLTLPSPLPPVESTLTLPEASATLSAPLPLSLNLRLRGAGPTHFFASGGLSHLGDLEATLTQTVAIGVTAINLQTSNLEIGTVELEAVATQEDGSSWGGNLGLGFQIALGERGGLVIEARGFYFPKRTLDWKAVDVAGLPPLQLELLRRTLEELPPIEFEPWWVQATIGVSFRF
jgi:hypothetical protein